MKTFIVAFLLCAVAHSKPCEIQQFISLPKTPHIIVDNTLSDREFNLLLIASREINKIGGAQYFKMARGKVRLQAAKDRHFVVTKEKLDREIYALTRNWVKGLSIRHFDILFNPSTPSKLFGTVAKHELLHALGLGHSEDRESIMYATTDRVKSFSKRDRQQIKCMYNQTVRKQQ